jgi:DNA repair exonuclease SbcCD ATPase subunit
MRVRKVHLQGFTKHVDTSVYLPERGVIVVTGLNGSGKSSLIEAVSMAGWGETLRGASPWQDGREGLVTVNTPEVDIQRARTKAGKAMLDWGTPEGHVAYENNTKAQAALEAVIGPFDVWRRTCVFSSQDAAHFTLSTDAERKRLLEAILALGRFDVALERCRVAKRAAEASLSMLSAQLEALKARLEAERARVADAQSTVKGLPPEEDVSALAQKVDRLAKMVASYDAEMTHLRGTQRVEERMLANASAKVDESARRLFALDKANCDRCGQKIPRSLVAPLRVAAEKDRDAMVVAERSAVAVREVVEAQLVELFEERIAFAARHAEHQARVHQAGVVSEQWKRARALLQNAQTGVAALEERITKGVELVVVADREVKTLEAVDVVLGMRGVRAHILGKTLSALEAVANSWLQRVAGPGLSLSLKSYSEKKSGGVTDAISLEVVGAGGGFGYKAASGGERRRLDIALLLALAEVAQAAHGRGAGSTLWVDEVFDALDSPGMEAVVKAVQELAKDRCVVVVTHDEVLADELHAVRRIHIDAGKVV